MESQINSDSTARLQAFSDGVFAVAITLLVLNIQVPRLTPDHPPLIQVLVDQWPSYFSYILSFFTIGIVWANHHQTFTYIVQANRTLLMLNLFLLMTVTLIPFTTGLLSEYILDPQEQRTAALIYGAGWLLLAVAYNLLVRYPMRTGFLDPSVTPEMQQTIRSRTMIGLVFYAIAVIVAFYSAALSVLICFALAIFYLIFRI